MHLASVCLTALLACAGCAVTQTPPEAVLAPMPGAASTASPEAQGLAAPAEAQGPTPDCRNYATQVLVDDAVQTLTGTACRQSDGSWRIAEAVAGQPGAVVVVYPPAGIIYAPDQAWLWGMPFGLGVGFGLDAFVFVDHDHHFHVFRHFHNFDHDHVFARRMPFPSRPPGFHPFFAPGHMHHG